MNATCSSSSSTRSSRVSTPTVCAAFQLPGVKVSVCTSAKPPRSLPTCTSVGLPLVIVTVTSAAGLLASASVKVSVSFSASVTALRDTTSPAASTSVVRAFAVVEANES